MNGLRTLVITRKILTKEFFTKWSDQYEKAYNKLEIDQKTISRLMNELEYGMSFLGITGIEDKLQENLKPTIENIRSAGIKVWMITGDKMETA
jgi:phospholipid-translocating ATPase